MIINKIYLNVFVAVTVIIQDFSFIRCDNVLEEEKIFLNKIFEKYGSQDRLSFEGFEHLMENLGLGHLKFTKKHNISDHRMQNGTFQDMHDVLKLHEHNHNQMNIIERQRRNAEDQLDCLTPNEMLKIYGLQADHDVAITPVSFLHMCPAIIYQLDSKICSNSEVNVLEKKTSAQSAWLNSFISVLIISLCGIVGMTLVPLLQRKAFDQILNLLVSMATGTLAGDALLHLLPHAIGIKENHEEAILKCTTVFLAILAFFIFESLIHLKKSKKKQTQEESDFVMVPLNEKEKEEETESIGIIVMTGDALHNLTDGLAVGASFRVDAVAGFATALAVLTHELPHELGDFAVLLKSGVTIKIALMYNLLSSFASFIGMAIGVSLGNFQSSSSWIYSITAGSFLYIALANLIPELHKYRKTGNAVVNIILQTFGMFLGLVIMFIIAIYEEDLEEWLR